MGIIIFTFYDYLLNIKKYFLKFSLKIKKNNLLTLIFIASAIIALFSFGQILINQYIWKIDLYLKFSASGKYSSSSSFLFTGISILFAFLPLFNSYRYRLFSKLTKIEFTFILLNFVAFIQIPLNFIASTIALRQSFYSIIISIISFGILNKYKPIIRNQFRFYSLSLSIFFAFLLLMAPTLSIYRNLLPI